MTPISARYTTRLASRAADWGFLRQPSSYVFVAVAGTLAFLTLYPTSFLFYGSLTDTPIGQVGQFTVDNYVQAYGDPETYALLTTSLLFALGSATLSVVIAQVLAWITIRTNAPFRAFFELTAIVPNVIPALLVSMSWVFLLNPSNGMVNVICEALIGSKPFNIYSLWGLIWVEGLVTAPLAFLIIAAALRGMDPALEESAKTLGSSDVGLTWRITFPLIRPAIFAAWTLNFIRAIESFDTPAIIALPAGIEVFTTKIFREAMDTFPSNQNLAAAYSVGLLTIALIFVYVYRRMTANVERYATVTGKAFRPYAIDLGKWKGVATAFASFLLSLMVFLPLFTLLLISLLPYYHTPTWADLDTLTLKHYYSLVDDDRILPAIWNSLTLAVGGATLCMLLASLISYITVKTQIAGRGLLEGLAFIPWAFPGTALAIGLLWAYVDFPLPVYNTLWILLIAYVTRFLPYGLRTVTSTIVQIHKELEEASSVCGAGFLTTFRRVVVPLMRPGIVAGWIFLATIFMREFGTSVFLYSPSAEPIGPLLFFLYQDGLYGVVGALGLLVCLVSITVVSIALRYAKIEMV